MATEVVFVVSNPDGFPESDLECPTLDEAREYARLVSTASRPVLNIYRVERELVETVRADG